MDHHICQGPSEINISPNSSQQEKESNNNKKIEEKHCNCLPEQPAFFMHLSQFNPVQPLAQLEEIIIMGINKEI